MKNAFHEFISISSDFLTGISEYSVYAYLIYPAMKRPAYTMCICRYSVSSCSEENYGERNFSDSQRIMTYFKGVQVKKFFMNLIRQIQI